MDWIDYCREMTLNVCHGKLVCSGKNLVEFFSQIDTTAVKTAIDIGCGLGTNSLWLSSLGIEVDGIDISEVAIDAAKNRKDSEVNLKP